jgi:hypothetical protein
MYHVIVEFKGLRDEGVFALCATQSDPESFGAINKTSLIRRHRLPGSDMAGVKMTPEVKLAPMPQA